MVKGGFKLSYHLLLLFSFGFCVGQSQGLLFAFLSFLVVCIFVISVFFGILFLPRISACSVYYYYFWILNCLILLIHGSCLPAFLPFITSWNFVLNQDQGFIGILFLIKIRACSLLLLLLLLLLKSNITSCFIR